MQQQPSRRFMGMSLEMQPALTMPVLDVETLIHLTTRLAHIMVQEIECLKQMRIKDLANIQAEKGKLINQLEGMRHEMDNHPEWIKELDEETREQLRELNTMFQQILKENMRYLKVAYQVNQDVIGAVRDALLQSSHSVGVYNQRGKDQRPMNQALSMTLNESV
jgi:seryl-tRNA synthetase